MAGDVVEVVFVPGLPEFLYRGENGEGESMLAPWIKLADAGPRGLVAPLLPSFDSDGTMGIGDVGTHTGRPMTNRFTAALILLDWRGESER